MALTWLRSPNHPTERGTCGFKNVKSSAICRNRPFVSLSEQPEDFDPGPGSYIFGLTGAARDDRLLADEVHREEDLVALAMGTDVDSTAISVQNERHGRHGRQCVPLCPTRR